MNSGTAPGFSIARDFVSQEQIDEARKKRLEEWEKAYASGQTDKQAPPEEEYDPRTLYEKIAANKQKKEDEFAEATRLSNLIHRIDEDEMDFLTTLETFEAQKRKEKMEEEQEELTEYRRAQAALNAPEHPAAGIAATAVAPPGASPTPAAHPAVRRKPNVQKAVLTSGIILKKSKRRASTSADIPAAETVAQDPNPSAARAKKRPRTADAGEHSRGAGDPAAASAAKKVERPPSPPAKGSIASAARVLASPPARRPPEADSAASPAGIALVSYGDDSSGEDDSK